MRELIVWCGAAGCDGVQAGAGAACIHQYTIYYCTSTHMIATAMQVNTNITTGARGGMREHITVGQRPQAPYHHALARVIMHSSRTCTCVVSGAARVRRAGAGHR